MRRRSFLHAAGTAALTATVAGCSALSGGSTGTLATRVSDNPGDIDDFSECIVTITEVRLKPADSDDATETEGATDAGEDEASDGIVTIDVDDATADLVKLQGEKSQLVDESEIETGDYEWLKLGISNVDATLKEGGSANVQMPGNAPLKFNKSFEIRADQTTSFTADVTPVKAGQSGKYIIQPVPKEVSVSYGSSESTGTTTETTTETTTAE